MKHLLNEEQKQNFISQVGRVYRNFKAINSGDWTHESAYREGIVDFCDSLIFVSSEITYDISNIRSEIESLFDEIDNENDSESKDEN
jgi:hypothetical protein